MRTCDAAGDRPCSVVVYREAGHTVGLVVDRILDIVDEEFTLQYPANRDRLLAAAVIQGQVTDVLDVPALIRAADPAFFDGIEAA